MIKISDHAIIRYLQRVYKFDLDGLIAQIVPDTIDKAVKTIGDGGYLVNDKIGSYKLIIRGGVVTTILDKKCIYHS